MLHHDQRFLDAVEARVTAIEALTDAEVVVVSAGRSGDYASVRYLLASITAFISLAVIVEIPAHVPALGMMLDLLLTWIAVAWVLDADPVLKRLLRESTKERAVTQAAAAEFHLEAVHSTPDRLGLLIYVSALEGRVELVPDIGLQRRIPEGAWAGARARFRHDDLEHFLGGLDEVGALLARAAPPTEGLDRIDLPNAPRIR